MYTDDELEAALLKFLTSEATTARSDAGVRDIIQAKAAVFDMVSAAFMLRPAAVFSVVWLASNNLRALVSEQLTDMQTVLTAAPRVSLTSKKVTSTTDLVNAEASLLTLTGAFAQRTSGVSGSVGPAIQRFNASIGTFIEAELRKNTVEDGEIVSTPEQLRAEISTLWASARTRHTQILSQVDQITSALSEFSAVRLPDSVVGSLLARIQGRLAALTTQMQAPTASQDSKNALLEFTAMRVLLGQATSFQAPTIKRCPLTDDAVGGAVLGSVGIPASVLGSVSGPYNYAPAAVLSYSVAGSPGAIALPPGSLTGPPVAATDVAAAFASDARLRAEVVRTAYEPFQGMRSSDVGEANVLWHRVATGTYLITDGTNLARAGSDFEGLGVEPGMVLSVTAPVPATRVITEVSGGVLTLDDVLPANTSDFMIGPDYSAEPPGLRVLVTGLDDDDEAQTAYYYTLSSGVGALLLDAPLAFPGSVRVLVFREQLRLSVRDVGPGLTLSILASDGAAAVGMAAPQTVFPALATLETGADLAARGVVPGDHLVLGTGVDTTVHTVASTTSSQIHFDPPRGYTPGSVSYVVEDAAAAAYLDLTVDLQDVDFPSATALDALMGRLSRGARFNGELVTTLTSYIAALLEVVSLADAYAVPRDEGVQQALRLMQESGFDRAADMFVALEFVAFFALTADGVSYKTWATRAAVSVARQVVPVSKDTRDPASGWQTQSIQPSTFDPTAQR